MPVEIGISNILQMKAFSAGGLTDYEEKAKVALLNIGIEETKGTELLRRFLFLLLKNLILNLFAVADAKFSHKLSTFTTLPKYYTPLDKRSLIVPFL